MHLHATANKHPFQPVTAKENYPKRITSDESEEEEEEEEQEQEEAGDLMWRVTTVPAMKTLFWRRLEIIERKRKTFRYLVMKSRYVHVSCENCQCLGAK